MKRFDLRHLGGEFLNRMCEIVRDDLSDGEVGIFIFEVGDFSNVQKSAKLVAENDWEMMNSLRFNEVDWTIMIKKDSAKIAESFGNNLAESPSFKNADSTLKSADSTNADSIKTSTDSTLQGTDSTKTDSTK